MFCAECGTKNKKGAQFCENCGTKIEGAKKEVTKKEVVAKDKKPMTKKNKMIVGIISVVAVVIIGLSIFLSSITNPKNIAEKFFKATANFDFDTIYEYLNVGDSEFTSKEMFNKLMTADLDEDDKPVIINYNVGKPVVSADKMSATVTITYMLQDEDESDTFDVKLVKDKKKKWLFFDNWKVNTKGISVVKDYEIEVLKGSNVNIEGVTLSSNYLDNEESTDGYDVYVIPSMFATSHNLTITLPMGLEVTDTMYVSEDNNYSYDLSLRDLTDEVKDSLKEVSKTSLQTLYDGVKDKKSFDDIKSSFEYENGDLTTLKSDYEKLANSVSTTLTSITFKEITLSSIDITSNGKLEVYLKANYDYSISYESGGEMKTHDSDDYDYVYLTFDYVNGTYKLVDTSSLNTYFSKYY